MNNHTSNSVVFGPAARTCCCLVALGMLLSAAAVCGGERTVDPRCTVLPWYDSSPLVNLADGGLLKIGKNVALVSHDEGKSWEERSNLSDGKGPGVPANGAAVMVRTHDGVIVLVYMDMGTFSFNWDDLHDEPIGTPKLDVWSTRSLDEGKTWIDRHRIMDGYCGALITMIETRDGHLIAPITSLVTKPGHHTVVVYTSEDRGRDWTRSNVIDLGGAGNHDGAMEPTIVELSDGRLMMLIRTNLDRFWEAFSDDHGVSWRTVRPSQISASSAPGYLLRLASGRIVLFWNRAEPEKGGWYLRRIRPFTHTPGSWSRSELSMAFSDDDARTWSAPVIIARDPGGLCYTTPLERRPGELLVGIHMAEPRTMLRLREADFVGAPAATSAKTARDTAAEPSATARRD